jgi:hypothetical protein
LTQVGQQIRRLFGFESDIEWVLDQKVSEFEILLFYYIEMGVFSDEIPVCGVQYESEMSNPQVKIENHHRVK